MFRIVRKATREYQSDQPTKFLSSFKDIGRLDLAHHCPKAKSSDHGCQPHDFADLLSDIYSCEDLVESPCRSSLRCLQQFSMLELQAALKTMSLNKCADDQGAVSANC